jgi:hypothetical protein
MRKIIHIDLDAFVRRESRSHDCSKKGGRSVIEPVVSPTVAWGLKRQGNTSLKAPRQSTHNLRVTTRLVKGR